MRLAVPSVHLPSRSGIGGQFAGCDKRGRDIGAQDVRRPGGAVPDSLGDLCVRDGGMGL